MTSETLGVLGTTGNDNDIIALTAVRLSALHKLGDEELAISSSKIRLLADLSLVVLGAN